MKKLLLHQFNTSTTHAVAFILLLFLCICNLNTNLHANALQMQMQMQTQTQIQPPTQHSSLIQNLHPIHPINLKLNMQQQHKQNNNNVAVRHGKKQSMKIERLDINYKDVDQKLIQQLVHDLFHHNHNINQQISTFNINKHSHSKLNQLLKEEQLELQSQSQSHSSSSSSSSSSTFSVSGPPPSAPTQASARPVDKPKYDFDHKMTVKLKDRFKPKDGKNRTAAFNATAVESIIDSLSEQDKANYVNFIEQQYFYTKRNINVFDTIMNELKDELVNLYKEYRKNVKFNPKNKNNKKLKHREKDYSIDEIALIEETIRQIKEKMTLQKNKNIFYKVRMQNAIQHKLDVALKNERKRQGKVAWDTQTTDEFNQILQQLDLEKVKAGLRIQKIKQRLSIMKNAIMKKVDQIPIVDNRSEQQQQTSNSSSASSSSSSSSSSSTPSVRIKPGFFASESQRDEYKQKMNSLMIELEQQMKEDENRMKVLYETLNHLTKAVLTGDENATELKEDAKKKIGELKKNLKPMNQEVFLISPNSILNK